MRISDEPFISNEEILQRIAELAVELKHELEGWNPVMLTVLQGALPFARQLRSALEFEHEHGTVYAKSYEGTESKGTVDVVLNLDTPLEGRDVVVIEDIVDTGRTATALTEQLLEHQAASVRMVSLLDKPSRRLVAYVPAWTGFTIEDHFVIGFGLDYNGEYRELPDIRILEP